MIQTKPKTRLFLDSGDDTQTSQAIEILGYLDGQTTNPSLVAQNPELQAKIAAGGKLTKQELLAEYKRIIQSISNQIPNGSVSIEVYADESTSVEEIMEQVREMNSWIPNAHIKLPIIKNGLAAARQCIDAGIKVNMTLCFSQEQAAAVHAATKGANKGDVFVSPFIGRLDDIDLDGMDLITAIQKMFQVNDSHVELLVASVRDVEHLLYSIYTQADIITIPFKVIEAWRDNGLKLPGVEIDNQTFADENTYFQKSESQDIPYHNLDLNKKVDEYNIQHDLTDKGLKKFAEDWNNLIG